ncbi:MAG: EexN family lipoprotein [Methylomonas sp.]
MIMKKNSFIAITAVLILAFAAFKVTIAAEAAAGEQAKSLAWYVANIPEARKQNQACHDNPGLQASTDCVNALHALEISFKGGN